MQTLIAYLQEKIRTSKRHIACNHLKNYEFFQRDVEAYMQYAFDKISVGFRLVLTKRTAGLASDKGEANLTAISTALGEYILKHSGYIEDENPWDWFRMRVMMGNLFIECFYQHNWINIGKNYDNTFIPYEKLNYNQKKSQAPYILVPQQWPAGIMHEEADELFGISLDKPEKISELMQPTEKPVIKGWSDSDAKRFLPNLTQEWIKAMDTLQQTGWRINTEVHNILHGYRNKILDQYKIFPEKYKSKIIEFDRTMSKANALKDKSFYYYMECDYRGRLYYTTPFLNFQSNDIARGQLLFDEQKEMTEEGLYWLAIHTACSYNQTYKIKELPEWLTTDYKPHLEKEELFDISVDKMTLDDRAQWTMQNIEWIVELWKKGEIRLEAEKPIAFLTCCQEWSNLMKANEEGRPYYSRLPIPIDGSNNGWQHLSAISKDKKAGKLVGVVPSDIQKDFYVQTAKELMKLMPEWFAERRMPMKAIRKGIAKRGSMTRAYSAGALKIAENMYLDCHVEDYTNKYNITKEDCVELARNLVKAIDIVCAGPLKTMKFLQEIAGQEIASEIAIEKGRKTIDWTTPSGFPVEYAAWSALDIGSKSTISCSMREDKPINNKTGEVYDTIRFDLRGKEYTEKPKIRSFMSGISPNFIHSMDASHMSLVITRWGGSFGPVHDSFSVHACDVNNLLDIVKDVFIEMYNHENFFKIIEDMILSESPTMTRPDLGELNINEVRESNYFFA